MIWKGNRHLITWSNDSSQVLLDATKPQDGVNGNAEGVHSAEGGDSGRATGSEVELVSSEAPRLVAHNQPFSIQE